jgi:hypothetical protein
LAYFQNKFALCVRCGETLVIMGEKSWKNGMEIFWENIHKITWFSDGKPVRTWRTPHFPEQKQCLPDKWGVIWNYIGYYKFGVSSRFILRGSLCTPHSEQILQRSSRFAQITQFFPEKVQEGKDYKLNRLFVKNIYKN